MVPKGLLRQALTEKKKESYQACYAESCQIEVGKEVAAQQTLAGKLQKFGNTCVVTLTLFDLRSATSQGAATAKGACTDEAVFDTAERAVARLIEVPNAEVAPREPARPTPAADAGVDHGDRDARVESSASERAEQARREARLRQIRGEWDELEKMARVLSPEVLTKKLERFLAEYGDDNPLKENAEQLLAKLAARTKKSAQPKLETAQDAERVAHQQVGARAAHEE